MRLFCERVSVCACNYFPFGFEGGVGDLIVMIPHHCLSIYFDNFPTPFGMRPMQGQRPISFTSISIRFYN